jgi:glyceraldehyde 3-phosphate dehydrogenase
MFKFDSVHGRFDGHVEEKDGKLLIKGKAIHVFNEKEPSAIGWGNAGAQYIVEATGIFTTEKEYVFCTDFSNVHAKIDLFTPEPKII